jgi:hypothetical protein
VGGMTGGGRGQDLVCIPSQVFPTQCSRQKEIVEQRR